MSNSLDPDQDRHFVGPDLGPNCLQRLPEDGKKSPLARKELMQSLWGQFYYFELSVIQIEEI